MRTFEVSLCAIRVFQHVFELYSKWLREAQAKQHQAWIKLVSSKISKYTVCMKQEKVRMKMSFGLVLFLVFVFFCRVPRWIQMLQKQWRFCLRGSFRRRRLSISWIESCGLEAQNWTWAAGVNLVASHPPWPPAAVTCRSKKKKKKTISASPRRLEMSFANADILISAATSSSKIV